MEKLTPQIAALYLGQKCETEFRGMPLSFRIESVDLFCRVTDGDRYDFSLDEIKLRLRPLSSLTESEARSLYCVYISDSNYPFVEGDRFLSWWKDTALLQTFEPFVLGFSEIYVKLLSLGFDLFGLIENGLAIDATAKS